MGKKPWPDSGPGEDWWENHVTVRHRGRRGGSARRRLGMVLLFLTLAACIIGLVYLLDDSLDVPLYDLAGMIGGIVASLQGMTDTVEMDQGRQAVDELVSDAAEAAGAGLSDIQGAIEDAGIADIGAGLPIRTESGFESNVVEDYIYELTNQNRAHAGLAELDRIPTIDSIARKHSQDMSDREYFSHDSPEGVDPTGRGMAAGYDCRKDYGSYYTTGLAENISQNYAYSSYMISGLMTSYTWLADEEALATQIVDGWMNSPGHRQNILDASYDRIGVGVVISPDEAVYSTQNFC